jgi:molecular chaperone DnaK
MEFLPGHTVGIDLGTTFSCIAHLDQEGHPVPLANDEGEVEVPSLILLAETGHVIVGPSRSRAAFEDPDRVVERIKREMGHVEYKRTFDGHEITPEFLSALILKKLKQDGEEKIGPITNAVITVPYYFNDARRKATQDAGRIAGLNVVDIINEPTAATLTYAWHRGELGAQAKQGARPKIAMVYDLGGGTFDVTLVKYTPTHFQVLATDGDVQLGGVDWNDRLLDYIAGEYQSKYGKDPRESRATVQVLRNDCDQAKIALTDQPQVTLTCRHEGKSVSATITREKFEELTADLMQRTIRPSSPPKTWMPSYWSADPPSCRPSPAASSKRPAWSPTREFRRTLRSRRAPPFMPPCSKPSTAAKKACWPNRSASTSPPSSRKTSTRTDWGSWPSIPAAGSISTTS